MTLREEMVREVTKYLREHFPEARLAAEEDPRTSNEVFTLTENGTARHVEVSEHWFDHDDDMMLLPNAIKVWGLAEKVRTLPPDGTVRVMTTGLE